MSKFLVVSAQSSPARANRFVRLDTDCRWIYVGQDIRLRMHWEKHLEGVQPRINIGELLQQAAEDLSDDFNEWIDRLGRSHNSLGWWIGQISEKNPFISSIYFDVCCLKIIRDQVQSSSKKTWLIVVESHGLRRTLTNYAQGANLDLIRIDRLSADLSAFKQSLICVAYGLWMRIALIKSWVSLWRVIRDLCNSQSRGESVDSNHKGSVLFHSWLRDDSVNNDGEFVDRFFGILPYHLRKQGYDVKYFCLPLTVVANHSEYYKLLKPLSESRLLFPSHIYMKFADVLKAIFYPFICCRLPSRVPTFRSWSLYHMVAEDRWKQVWSFRTSAAYLYYAFAIRLGMDGRKFSRVLGTFENHIWERAMNLGVRQSNVSDRIIGYQHTTLHWNYHCYSPKSFELQTGGLPDQIVCTGSYWAEELLRRGYKHVNVGGALRFDTLPDNIEPRNRSNSKPIILVTSNAGENLTLEVLRNMYLAFGEDPDIKIWIKIHPHLHLTSSHFDSVFDGDMPQHFYIKEESVPELLSNIDLLVYSSTSLCFEALSMGIPVLSVVPETFIDLDDLRFFPQLRCAAINHEDLRVKAQKILGQSNDEYLNWLSNIKEPMKTVFTPVTSGTLEAFTVSEELSEK